MTKLYILAFARSFYYAKCFIPTFIPYFTSFGVVFPKFLSECPLTLYKEPFRKFQDYRFSDLGCAFTPVYLSQSPSIYVYIYRNTHIQELFIVLYMVLCRLINNPDKSRSKFKGIFSVIIEL